jgi:hypothetical protein
MFPQLENFHIGDNGLYYGLYGGLDYSAGTEDGTVTGSSADPTPVDAYDEEFYDHDLALRNASTPAERLDAHIDVVEDVSGLLFDAVSHTVLGWDLF